MHVNKNGNAPRHQASILKTINMHQNVVGFPTDGQAGDAAVEVESLLAVSLDATRLVAVITMTGAVEERLSLGKFEGEELGETVVTL